jgi:hypothetical protein
LLSCFQLLSTTRWCSSVKTERSAGARRAHGDGGAAVLSRLPGSRAHDLVEHLGHDCRCDQISPVDQSITILTPQLTRGDEIETVTQRRGVTDGRTGRDGRPPRSGAGRVFAKDVWAALMVAERERLLSPVDLRVVLLEPRHAENDVEAAECSGDEVERLGVGADADGGLGQKASGHGAVAVGHAHGERMLGKSEAVLGSKGRRNEIARGAAVDEHDCGVRAEGARELDEDAAGLRSGGSVRVRGWCWRGGGARRLRMVRASRGDGERGCPCRWCWLGGAGIVAGIGEGVGVPL